MTVDLFKILKPLTVLFQATGDKAFYSNKRLEIYWLDDYGFMLSFNVFSLSMFRSDVEMS